MYLLPKNTMPKIATCGTIGNYLKISRIYHSRRQSF